MIKKIFTSHLVVCLILSLCLLPVQTGLAFTVGEEREVGEKLLYTVRANFEVLDEPDLKQYLRELGREVIDVAGVQFFDYHFFVVDSKEFNAFAAPSGLIFFHSGLIEKMGSENELVSVLAHEIGHIVKRHISSRIEKQKQISVATVGMILAAIALGGGPATEALMTGSMAAGQSASLHFSRLDEEEADLLAYDWMKKLQRDPHGQAEMLKTMRQIARYRSAKVPQYLLTHPNPEARLNYVQTLIETEEDDLSEFQKGDDFRFLRFKYRVLSATRDSSYLRKYFATVLQKKELSDMERIMAQYGMAQLQRVDNNYKESLRLLEDVITAMGSETVLLVDKGVVELESGQIERAYRTLSAAYDKDRENSYAAYSLARSCLQKGLLEQAERLYKSVMYAFPDVAKTYFELGKVSSAMGDGISARFYLGKYHLSKGRLELAKKNLKEVVEKSDEGKPEVLAEAKETLKLIERLES